MKKLFVWIQKYERHLSALAMAGGFIIDSLFFERIDLWQTHIVFVGYAAVCFVAIPLLHLLEARAARGLDRPRWHSLLPIATQFALGGFWSGFVIFYGRSAVFGASWPFLLFLVLVFLGNEYFRQYHARLVFTSVLFFFALYSYAIFAVPVYTGTLGVLTFIGSGVLAAGLFALFIMLLRTLGRERFQMDLSRIRAGAIAVFLVVNLSYFTNILPPLPLSLESAGVYHEVWRVPGAYLAKDESSQPWHVRYLGFMPTLHIIPGEYIYAYGSVFAPTALATSVVHAWQWYDPAKKRWVEQSKITYSIVGGRDGGYRGYSAFPIQNEGKWRVDIETSDGRLIARLPFRAAFTSTAVPQETITLK